MTGPEETIVPATPGLVAHYLGKAPPYSFRGWIALRDGVPVGMAGIYDENGTKVAFSEFRPDMQPSKRTMVKGVRLVRQMMGAIKRPVFAICNPDLPTAPNLLARLGFLSTGEHSERGEIMVRVGDV